MLTVIGRSVPRLSGYAVLFLVLRDGSEQITKCCSVQVITATLVSKVMDRGSVEASTEMRVQPGWAYSGKPFILTRCTLSVESMLRFYHPPSPSLSVGLGLGPFLKN